MKRGLMQNSAIALSLVASSLATQSAHAATVYDALTAFTNGAAATSPSPSDLGQITLASTGSVALTNISFLYNAAQVDDIVVVSFWTNVPTTQATDVLNVSGGAVLLGTVQTTLATANGTASIAIPNTVVPSTVFVERQIFTSAGVLDSAAYMSAGNKNNLTSGLAPNIGSNSGWDYIDGNFINSLFGYAVALDGKFDASEALGTGSTLPSGGDSLVPYYQEMTLSGTAVPEPASLGVLGLGAAAFLRRSNRRRA